MIQIKQPLLRGPPFHTFDQAGYSAQAADTSSVHQGSHILPPTTGRAWLQNFSQDLSRWQQWQAFLNFPPPVLPSVNARAFLDSSAVTAETF